MASFYAMLGRESKLRGEVAIDEVSEYSYMAEGIEAYVDYKGSASEVVRQLVNGLKSGMSYLGARTIEELRRNALFIQITHAAYLESLPHDVERIR
jgi:IMP dehydrogenase